MLNWQILRDQGSPLNWRRVVFGDGDFFGKVVFFWGLLFFIGCLCCLM